MVTVKSSQKIFTDSEVSTLTGICVEHVHNFAKTRHLGFIARAMNPKWRVLAKLWTCSTQIPVRVETSESVKIFWLDFTVTMALLLGLGPNLCSQSLRCCMHLI